LIYKKNRYLPILLSSALYFGSVDVQFINAATEQPPESLAISDGAYFSKTPNLKYNLNRSFADIEITITEGR